MQQDRNQKKKNQSLWSIVIFVIIAVVSMLEDVSGNAFFLILMLLLILTPVVVIVFAIMTGKKKYAASDHTHDRIDQRKDLKINPATGKVEASPLKGTPQHSAREHWKQQLDGLLANGTIDRAEYQALLNRKF